MGAFKLLLVLLVVYNNFNHAHSKSVDLTDSENERALLEVFSTILSSPETKNIETRSIEAEKIIFTDQEIAEVVAILKEKYPESASYVTEEMVKRKVNDVVPSAQYLIKFVFDGLRNVPREVDEERLKEVILQIMKEASELSFALKDEFGVEKSHIGVTAAPIAADAEAALPTVTLPPHLSYDLTLPPPSRSFQRDFIITPNQVRRALVHIHRRKLLRHGLLSSRNAPKIIAKQLNGLPPFAKLLTRTLLDNYYPSYFPSQPSHPGNNAVTLRESAHVPAMRVAGDEEVEDVPTGKVEHTDIIESDPSADETSEDETSENDFRPGHISGPRGDAEALSKSEVQDLVLNLVKEIFSRHAAIGKHVSDAVQHNDEVDKIKQERMRVSAGRTKAGKKLGKGVKDKGKGGKKPGKGGKKPGKGGKKPGKGGKKPGKGKNDKEKGGKKPGKDKGKGGKKPGKGEKKPGKGGKKPGKGGKKPGKGGKKPGKGGKKSKRNVEGEADFEAQ